MRVASDEGCDLLFDTEKSATVELGRDLWVHNRVSAAGLQVAPDPLEGIALGEAARAVHVQKEVDSLAAAVSHRADVGTDSGTVQELHVLPGRRGVVDVGGGAQHVQLGAVDELGGG